MTFKGLFSHFVNILRVLVDCRVPKLYSNRVENIILITGFARTGSTLLGSLLNSHEDIVVSTELSLLKLSYLPIPNWVLLKLISLRDLQFRKNGFRWTKYTYQVTKNNNWNEYPCIIGDKKAGETSRLLLAGYSKEKLEQRFGSPVRLLVIIRNPFDTIATQYLNKNQDLNLVIDDYFEKAANLDLYLKQMDSQDYQIIYLEELIINFQETFTRILTFLGIKGSCKYISQCKAIMLPEPNQSRINIDIPDDTKDAIETQIKINHLFKYYEDN